MEGEPTTKGLWLKPGPIIAGIVLLVTLLGVGAIAAGCNVLPQLVPVQAEAGTPTATATASPIVAPVLDITPREGGPGTRITVTGKGWRPGNTVFIRLENPRTGEVPAVDQASAIVTDAGDFVVRFTYPLDPRWASTPEMLITAVDTAIQKRVSAAFRLTGVTLPTVTATATATAGVTPLVPTVAPPTLTRVPPTATSTRVPPTATRVPPTATRVLPTATPVPPTATPVITDWRGEYYANVNLGGQPVLTRNDWTVDFNWGSGAPAAGLPADGFSARWTRAFEFDSATYRFYVTVDDGARLYVDGQLVLDEWRDSSVREVFADVPLARGGHTIRLEYYERTGVAQLRLRWLP